MKNNNFNSSQNNSSLSFLKTSKTIKNYKIINFLAFSLIELSIVLIIIGLLVAGITGGQSLIKSAKLRAFMNELNGYKQAVSSFYVAKDRLPGDLNNLGIIGRDSGQTYTTSSFSEPYNKVAPNVYSAPFIDLYLEKIIDFKPSETNPTGGAGIGYPYSKIYKKSYYYFINYTSAGSSTYYTNAIKINSPYLRLNVSSTDRPNTASDFKIIDQKMDDGLYNNGTIRAECYTSKKGWSASYDDVINDKGNATQCDWFIYNMGF